MIKSELVEIKGNDYLFNMISLFQLSWLETYRFFDSLTRANPNCKFIFENASRVYLFPLIPVMPSEIVATGGLSIIGEVDISKKAMKNFPRQNQLYTFKITGERDLSINLADKVYIHEINLLNHGTLTLERCNKVHINSVKNAQEVNVINVIEDNLNIKNVHGAINTCDSSGYREQWKIEHLTLQEYLTND